MGYGTFVYLFDKKNYTGASTRFDGGQSLSRIEAAGSGNWDGRAWSISTGDESWVELFRDHDFRGSVLRLGPNSTIRDLGNFSVDGKSFGAAAQSMRLHANRPRDWAGSATEDRPHYTLSDLRRASINRTVKDLAVSTLGAAPEVGTVLSGILSAIWPFGEDSTAIWAEMHGWVKTVLHGVVADVTGNIEESLIKGLGNVIADTRASPTEKKFDFLYEEVRRIEALFTNRKDPASSLGYVTIFGTIALAIYRVGYFSYTDIYKSEPSETDYDQKLANLNSGIRHLRKTVYDGVQMARQRRQEQVWIQHYKKWWSFGGAGSYQVFDDNTGWQSDKWSYNNVNAENSAGGSAERNQAYFRDSNSGPTFDATFDVYLEVADLWTYFDCPPDAPFAPQRQRKTVSMGRWGMVAAPPDWASYPGKHRDFSVSAKENSRITRVVLHNDDKLEGIEVDIDGSRALMAGKESKSRTEIVLAENESIVGVFGAWDERINQVRVRKAAIDVSGELLASPTEAGAGQNKDGKPFSSAGADGAGGALTGWFGQIGEDDKLVGLGCHWTHQRILPR
ncbi:MAG TPA: hypothetical protein VIM02_00770 [Rhizomicrobium sp.]|jgi:hypothetical protein